jgi:ubiquitin-conjugating enzyme E2 M
LGIGGREIHVPIGKRVTAAELRIQKDIAELDSGTVGEVVFPNPNDLTLFHLDVKPDSGYWCGAKYRFTVTIPGLSSLLARELSL